MLIGLHVSVAPAVEYNGSTESTTTGSRLVGIETTDLLPITIYTRADILRSGESSVADFIRQLPINSLGSYRPQSGNTAQENALANLRGLGAFRTLVLIDGRRMPKSTTISSSPNLNLIPMGSVDRIEVLRGGASAIYGTDAVSGVINIITRSEYQGVEFMSGAGNPSIPESGGETEYGSAIFGSHSERSSLVTGISWNEREVIYSRDVPWQTRVESVYGNSFTTITDGFDNFDWTSFIGGCDFPDTGYFTTTNFNSPNGTRCAYDYSLVASEDASTENKAFFTQASHAINDHWSLNADILFSQAESFARSAPVPDSSFWSIPLSASSPNNPTNPVSPLYDPSLGLTPQSVNWWHRFDSLGNRDTTATTQLLDVHLAGQGRIGAADLNIGFRHTDNRTQVVGKNFLLRSVAQQYIEDGTYDLLNPYSASDQVLSAMRFTRFRNARFDQNEYYAHVSFDVFELEGGRAKAVVGAEILEEKYFDIEDPQSQAELVGGTAGSSAFAIRDTQSVFFESHFPILEELSINMSARYDDYSDLGDDLAGKFSLNFKPFESLAMIFSYSTDHTAPNLNAMNVFHSTSVTSVRFAYPGCYPCDFNIIEVRSANPLLESEQVNQLNLTINYNPTDWLNLSIAYWDLELEDKITVISAQQVLNGSIGIGPPVAGLSCLFTPAGVVTQCNTGFANLGTLNASGVDIDAQLSFPLFNGELTNNLVIHHTLDLENDDSENNLIGSPGFPQQRMALNNNYAWNNWNFGYSINLIGPHEGVYQRTNPAPSWVTHDVQISYATPWDGLITVGADNIGENAPPINAGLLTNKPYDFSLYHGFGRTVYAQYTQTF